MLQALTILLIFQLVGEIITRTLQLPVPGPVLGMLFLFIVLWLRGSTPPNLRDTAGGILKHLSLLFVPAGVGVMAHFSLLRQEWIALVITLVGSTMIAIVATALGMQFLRQVTER